MLDYAKRGFGETVTLTSKGKVMHPARVPAVIRADTSVPRRAGVVVFGAGVVAGVAVVWRVWRHGTHVDGWASLAIMRLRLNGRPLRFMGGIGEALSRSLAEGRRRPRRVVWEVVESRCPGKISA